MFQSAELEPCGMSASGRKLTSDGESLMSAFLPIADIQMTTCDVGFVPTADVLPVVRTRSKRSSACNCFGARALAYDAGTGFRVANLPGNLSARLFRLERRRRRPGVGIERRC
jgi:hypothetical protein